MAQVTRLNITQQGGSSKTVAFTDDIKLTSLAEGNLIKVNTTNKTATVAVNSSKLSLNETDGNVVVNTPLELAIETTTPENDSKLHAVQTAGGVKLYWGSNVIEAHDPQEGYVTTQDFNNHAGNAGDAKHLSAEQLELVAAVPTTGTIATEDKVDELIDAALTPIETSIDELKAVTSGYTAEGAIKTAVDAAQTAADDAATAATAADEKAQGAVDAIGVWTTITDKTVKAAIEENKTEISALKGNHFIVVDTRPATGEPNCIYLIPKSGSEIENVKEEWIYVNGAWEKIGDTAVDLSEYSKTTAVQSMISNAVATETAAREAADTALAGRVSTLETSSTTAATDITNLKNVTSGYADTGSIKNAVDGAQSTANSALTKANTAVQSASGDANINASVSNTEVTVSVADNSTLANILSVCTIITSEE